MTYPDTAAIAPPASHSSTNRVWISPCRKAGSSVQRDGRRDPLDHELVQRHPHARDGLIAIRSMGQQLGDERIVLGGDPVGLVGGGVHPHSRSPRLVKAGDRPRRRHEVALGILGVDPALDRMAAELDPLPCEAQRLAGGHE
jgi:hypothetical protein